MTVRPVSGDPLWRCAIGAAFQTTTSVIPQASQTGNLKIVTNAMVKEVHLDDSRKASGVTFVDQLNRENVEVDADHIILALGARETSACRWSKSEAFPNGLANSSGQVGRNLDSLGAGVSGYIPALRDRPKYNEDGHTGNHLYIPWWDREGQKNGELNFSRGYHFEVGARFSSHGMGIASAVEGYGKQAKDDIRSNYGTNIGLSLRGEMLVSDDCYCEIDEDTVSVGNPGPQIHWKWSEQELDQVAHGHNGAGKSLRPWGVV